MKHIIVSDTRPSFLQNLNTYILIEEKRLTITTAVSAEQAAAIVSSQSAGCILAICENAIEDIMPGTLDQLLGSPAEIYGYCVTANGRFQFAELGIPCIGLVQDAKKLADTLEQDIIPVVDAVSRGTSPSAGGRPAAPVRQQHGAAVFPEAPPAEVPAPQPAAPGARNMRGSYPEPQAQRHPHSRGSSGPSLRQPRTDTPQEPDALYPPEPTRAGTSSGFSGQEYGYPAQQRAPTGAEKMYQSRQQREYEEADRELRRDGFFESAPKPVRARVVTVYAAKGGVGKTTIAAETAVCLALTNNGRRRIRACLVDYNIDFGDVITTLNLDSKGPCMTDWCSDIRARMEAGEDPDAINYTREEMQDAYLQYMTKNGLYVLVAPVVHEDSMDIGEAELTVILRNLAENGGFDYIICDTGNNTRDSSVLALEAADYVLMVATQDVTTANCNDSFIATITKIGFDTTKIRLVVNNVLPTQSTGISVREVEENFPYPCAARIKRDDTVIKSNNYGEPLVYNPKHEFTKQIQNIVHFITDSRIVPEMEEAPQKEGFLKKLFGKKGAS